MALYYYPRYSLKQDASPPRLYLLATVSDRFSEFPPKLIKPSLHFPHLLFDLKPTKFLYKLIITLLNCYLSAVMLKADGKDITKRSSARRNRYLLVFNCQLAPAAAGRLGTLAKLDTKNPVMYLDFPEGRLRLSGTLVFPKNKYLVLRLGKEALCEDVLESMIVFSEAHWIGTEAENPDENELPMPESLKTTRRHTNVNFGGRGDTTMQAGTNELDYEETQDEDMGDAVLPSQQQASQPASQRRGSRRAGATGKRARYAEDSDASFGDDDDEDNDGDSDAEPAPRKLPRVANTTATAAVRKLPSAAKSKPASQKTENKPQSHMVINLADDTSDDEDQPLVARGGGAKRSSLGGAKKPTPQAKKSTSAKKSQKSQESGEEEDIIDLASASSDEDDDGDAGGSLPASQRPRRAAAPQKLRDTEDEDEDGSEDNGGSSDGEEEEEEGSDGGAASESEEEYAGDDASEEESDGYAPSE
jgi:hypothetical protein